MFKMILIGIIFSILIWCNNQELEIKWEVPYMEKDINMKWIDIEWEVPYMEKDINMKWTDIEGEVPYMEKDLNLKSTDLKLGTWILIDNL
jgi:hypothetical protein